MRPHTQRHTHHLHVQKSLHKKHFILRKGRFTNQTVVQSLSHVWLFVTAWTMAHQAPLFLDFPVKWCISLFPSTGVGCHFLLQGILLTMESNQSILHWQVGSLPLSHQESPQTEGLNQSILHCQVGSLPLSHQESPKIPSDIYKEDFSFSRKQKIEEKKNS